jgi:hypothetical protein
MDIVSSIENRPLNTPPNHRLNRLQKLLGTNKLREFENKIVNEQVGTVAHKSR